MTFFSGRNRSGLKSPSVVYGLAIVLIVAGLSLLNAFERADQFMLDRAFQWRGTSEPRDEIAIVAISQRDFEMGAPRWPWSRSLMARLIDSISELEPAVIVVDILYSEPTSSESVISEAQFDEIRPFLYQVLSGVSLEVRSRQGVSRIGPGNPAFDEIVSGSGRAELQDLELVNAVLSARESGIHIVMASHTIADESVAGLARPFPALYEAAGGSTGLVGIRLDSDGILRRYIPYGKDENGDFQYAMALVAVAEYESATLPDEPDPNGDVRLSNGMLAEIQDGTFLVNFRGPPGTHPTFQALDVLKGREGVADGLRGKIVFLGVTDPSVEDVLPTPYSGIDRMAGVEIHAAAADTILSQRFISELPRTVESVLILLLVVFAIYLVRSAKVTLAVGGYFAVVGALTGAWALLFFRLDHILPLTSLATATSLAFVAALVDRVGIEQLEKQKARAMLSRYLAPSVVADMLRGSGLDGLGGARSEISVLFSDIRGFTSISEDLAPEETVELLNRYLDVMTEVVFRNGGTVDKFEGDAILAFFGAPQPQADHARRAVRTALDMIDQLNELEGMWRERTGKSLRIGVGIHTGEAFVGNIGSQRRMDYTIIGDTVNLASRLQDLTKEYGVSILLSGTARESAGDVAQYRDLGEVQVRGRQHSVKILEAIADLHGRSATMESDSAHPGSQRFQPITAD